MASKWTRPQLLELAWAFQPACILTAAADLDLFNSLAPHPMTASALAKACKVNLRAMTVLLDALVALKVLEKRKTRYSLSPRIPELLTDAGSDTVLEMVRHLGNCLRRWDQLAQVVQSGKPACFVPSIRGAKADQESFIYAMQNLAEPMAENLIQKLQPIKFKCLLDIGGASGSWTIAFLRKVPHAKAILFDLPGVIPLARKRLTEAGLIDRVRLVPGDFYTDPLPRGADFIWLSAIAHQNSRVQNRQLFKKIHTALAPGGTLAIRDMVMEDSKTSPIAGALFAINMLVATPGGGTYSFQEYAQDLRAAGFKNIQWRYRDPGMNSILTAQLAK